MPEVPSSSRAFTTRGTQDRPSSHAPGVGRVNGTRGRTNGLVNGMGRTNGLVNGRGRTNGLHTGIGFVNGVRLRRSTSGVVASSDLRRTGAFVATSVAVMMILSFYFGTPEPPVSPFSIDGDFSEWTSVAQYPDDIDSIPAEADLLSFAVHEEPGRLFVYGRMRSAPFVGNPTSSVYVLLDNPARTGYDVEGFDVDYLAELWGWGGQLREVFLREWSGDPDRHNATAFRGADSFAAASSGSEFELLLTETGVDLDSSVDLRIRIVGRFDEGLDSGMTVGRRSGALRVDQRPLTALLSATTSVLELRVRAFAENIEVRSLLFDHTGGGTLIVPSPQFVVPAGQERIELVGLDPSGLAAGSLVSLRLRGVDAFASGTGGSLPSTVAGLGARVYVGAAPAGFAVDGLFADWTGATPDPNENVPASIDILDSAFAVRSDTFFYVRTEGPILTGAILPERKAIPPAPSAGNGSVPVIPLRRISEDVLRIYVDTDGLPGGFSFGGIGADRLLEVRGRSGQITATALFSWNTASWQWDPRVGPFDIAFIGTQFEASTSLAFLGPLNNPRTVFAMTDWSARSDLTDVPRASLGPSLLVAGSPAPLHALLPDEIDATELVNTPVIDGRCDSFPGEYTGASIGSTPGQLTFAVGRRDDTQFLFVCIRADGDPSRHNNDWGEVIFDTLHDGGLAPQVDDKLFWVFGNGDNTLSSWQGNGVAWNGLCPTCDLGNDGESRWSGAFEFYEFQTRYTDVWATLTPAFGQAAGFAIILYNFNAGTLLTWGGPAVDENIPDTWGHLFYPIPELPLPALAAISVVLVPLLRRRRGRPGA